jgi:2',3'-cyclic-nucleotide 2'-phosphodiesterase (5'-nucleotidase family)
VNTGTCKDDMKSRRECYGGVPRMAGYIQQVRDTNPEAILLNAGDYYQGTMWYTIFKYEPVVEFSNLLNYTAMALGNHDFDDGSEGLQPFVERVNYPVLAANLNTSVLTGIDKSVVVMVKGRKVGIIGYVTQDTGTISQPGEGNAFLDVVESVREEAKER